MNRYKILFVFSVMIMLSGCERQLSAQQAGEEMGDRQAGADPEQMTSKAPGNDQKVKGKTAFPIYPPSGVEMELKRISEHVWYVQGAAGIATDNEGFVSNATVIIGDKGIVVVDALGSPSLAQLLVEKVRRISDKPFLKVIATHYHADHIYGLQVFQERGAEVLAPLGADEYLDSPATAERLNERRFSLQPWVNKNTRLVFPDRMIDASEKHDIGGLTLSVSYLGKAHSDGDLSVYVEEDAVLISGDIIFEGRVPFVGDANTKQWLDVLTAMEQRKMKALIPGHGEQAGNPDEVVNLMRRYLQTLRQQMAGSVEEMMTFDEAYAGSDWTEFAHLPAFEEANRINAYQVFLSLEAELLAQ